MDGDISLFRSREGGDILDENGIKNSKILTEVEEFIN